MKLKIICAAAITCIATNVVASSCTQTVGKALAEKYASECLFMSSATHPPCNVVNECSLLINEIKHGCESNTSPLPFFCKFYTNKGVIAAPTGPVSKACTNVNSEEKLTECIKSETKKSDDQLNSLYQQVIKKAKDNDEVLATYPSEKRFPTDVQNLKATQRAWLSFRNKECSFITVHISEAVLPLVQADCMVKLSNDRSKQLESYLSCHFLSTYSACPF